MAWQNWEIFAKGILLLFIEQPQSNCDTLSLVELGIQGDQNANMNCFPKEDQNKTQTLTQNIQPL